MVKHEGWARDDRFLRQFFALEVIDSSEADSEESLRKARAGRQYTQVFGGGIVGVTFEKDGSYYLVDPDGGYELLESHFMNPIRRMNSAIQLIGRLDNEENGTGPDYDAVFRTFGLTDEEAATW